MAKSLIDPKPGEAKAIVEEQPQKPCRFRVLLNMDHPLEVRIKGSHWIFRPEKPEILSDVEFLSPDFQAQIGRFGWTEVE